MENVNGINSVWGVLHCDANPGGSCNEPNGLGARRPCPTTRCQAGFHTYRLEWDRRRTPNELRWYVDGLRHHQVRQDQVSPTAWSRMTAHRDYFLLLNLAIGGAFPNALAGEWNARDGRITELGRHCVLDPAAGNKIVIAVRACAVGQQTAR